MSSAQPPLPPPEENGSSNNEHKPEAQTSSSSQPENATAGEGAMDTTPDRPPEETWDDIPEEIKSLSTDEISTRTRLIDNDLRVRTLALLALRSAYPASGDPLRDIEIATRTSRYEGEDSGQWGED